MPQLSDAARVGALITRLRDILGDNFDRRVKKLGLEGQLSGAGDGGAKALRALVLGDASAGDMDEIERTVAHWEAVKLAGERIDALAQAELDANSQKVYDDIRLNIIRRENGGESARTLERYARLEKREKAAISRAPDLRPATTAELVGQERALRAVTACLSARSPQHMLLCGPAGVGKTSAARLALDIAKSLPRSCFGKDAPFVEADGSAMRADPHGGADPLIGSVHDPIYQGARAELAAYSVPEPRTGLVTQASGGVLFIDEIGEMRPESLNKLLKVLEDRRVYFNSSYYDPSEQMPKYVRQLFERGAPADIVLIGATTREPRELPAALLSRCAVIDFEPLGFEQLLRVVRSAAKRAGVPLLPGAAEALASAALDGREAVRLLLTAQGLASMRGQDAVCQDAAREAALLFSRPAPSELPQRAGVVAALGVYGRNGCVLGLEALLRPGKGGASINEAAGAMARDAARHAMTAVNELTYGALTGLEAEINCMGGGNVDGPSVGLACALAIYSAFKGVAPKDGIAVTGEIALAGDVLPVGGLDEKLRAACAAGYSGVLLPAANAGRHAPGVREFACAHLKDAIDFLGLA